MEFVLALSQAIWFVGAVVLIIAGVAGVRDGLAIAGAILLAAFLLAESARATAAGNVVDATA